MYLASPNDHAMNCVRVQMEEVSEEETAHSTAPSGRSLAALSGAAGAQGSALEEAIKLSLARDLLTPGSLTDMTHLGIACHLATVSSEIAAVLTIIASSTPSPPFPPKLLHFSFAGLVRERVEGHSMADLSHLAYCNQDNSLQQIPWLSQR